MAWKQLASETFFVMLFLRCSKDNTPTKRIVKHFWNNTGTTLEQVCTSAASPFLIDKTGAIR